MRHNLIRLKQLSFILSTISFLTLSNAATATVIYVDGDDTAVFVNDGAFLDGTDATTPSAFSTPELIKNQGNETLTSDGVQLTGVPFISYLGNYYVQLIYDQQETANTGGQPDRERVQLTGLSAYVGPDANFANATLVWSLTGGDEVWVNDQNRTGGPFPSTDTTQGAGGDVRLNIPFSIFPSGTTSSDYLFFRATQADSDNGGDEWVLNGDGETLPPATPVPEPAAGLLALVGLAAVGYRRWVK
jgi:hypothetical protein